MLLLATWHTSIEVTFLYNLLFIGTSLLALSTLYRITEYFTVISKHQTAKKALKQLEK